MELQVLLKFWILATEINGVFPLPLSLSLKAVEVWFLNLRRKNETAICLRPTGRYYRRFT